MKTTRRFLMGAAAGLALAGMVFGGNSADAKTLKIAAIVQSLNTEYNVLWADAAKAHPALADGTATLTVLDGRQDVLTQSNLFDTAITEKYDAIIFIPVDIDAGNEPIERAKAAGIPVFGSNTMVSNTALYDAYINSDDVEAGEMLAKAVIDKAGPQAKVVILEGMLGQSAQVQRLEGIQKVLKENPGVTILEQNTANWSRAEAITLMENFLTSHGDAIQGVLAENDEMAVGAIEGIRNHGLDPKAVPVAGVDGIKDALEAVKRGEQSMSILQDANGQAQGAIDLALHKIVGDSYKPRAAVWDVNGGKLAWNDGKDQHYYVPWLAVTSENVDKVLVGN
ncbi:sugar ABC transporter substrate-binding protein [Mesorhizobium sp. M7A.F.Ca.US.006.04.2.1]|uniref:substrate-binding domain-containing protein n=1 Tax=unclassified Mesorhizobium TaxID=325217 RepID=UPI000FCB9873|nr:MULTISPECIES: substrate-binding domain-containing protein [unclassified Mesorhizobium]RUX78161.1 sugar ABC transporter substrate-binding protein [Mesorhizobium sp. M7A.F.Ca.US.005.03.1.1]RUY17212.1 sugar ABC transporter substrate-binding protein [Mesorhizobium sp. M7A.F.Ca.US.005.03.2.1]RUY29927.1 sugar ABC transporter substrate-binding protein [Mesorhizobium sp. M7A.F.Ca.US.001.04.2.1]RUY45684.1 sugar ABC transporter substrate-binding protein [Mesorhizobium sp. M7A.F.Ca.US.001.04.1.1]RVA05